MEDEQKTNEIYDSSVGQRNYDESDSKIEPKDTLVNKNENNSSSCQKTQEKTIINSINVRAGNKEIKEEPADISSDQYRYGEESFFLPHDEESQSGDYTQFQNIGDLYNNITREKDNSEFIDFNIIQQINVNNEFYSNQTLNHYNSNFLNSLTDERSTQGNHGLRNENQDWSNFGSVTNTYFESQSTRSKTELDPT